MQAGITEIVSHPVTDRPSKWRDDLLLASSLIEEAGIKYREIYV